jgi:hypothetical protein
VAENPITKELDNKAKEESMKRLNPVQRSLPFMSTEASTGLIVATNLSSVLDIIKEQKKQDNP